MSQNETQSLFELVGQYLQGDDLNFESVADNAGYIGTLDGEHMNCKIVIRTDSESDLHSFQVTSLLPVKAPIKTRTVMAELFARINYDLAIGAFELNMDDGSLSYGVIIDLMDGVLTKSMLERMVGVNLNIVDEYAPTFISVMYGGVNSSDAYKAYIKQSKQEDILH